MAREPFYSQVSKDSLLNHQGSQGLHHTASSGRHKSHDRGKEIEDHRSWIWKWKCFKNKIWMIWTWTREQYKRWNVRKQCIKGLHEWDPHFLFRTKQDQLFFLILPTQLKHSVSKDWTFCSLTQPILKIVKNSVCFGG